MRRSIDPTLVDAMLSKPGGEDVRFEGLVNRQVVEPVSMGWLDGSNLGCGNWLDCHYLGGGGRLDVLVEVGGCGTWVSDLSVSDFSVSSHSIGEQVNSVRDWDSTLGDVLIEESSGIAEGKSPLMNP